MDLSDLSAECACSHKIESLKFILKSKGYEIKSIWDVAIVASQFSCSNCTKNDCKIYDNNKKLLFDMTRAIYCSKCSYPLPIPRIEIAPETAICVPCLNDPNWYVGHTLFKADITNYKYRRKRLSKIPKVPDNKEICPDCGGMTRVSYNQNSKQFFLGCTNYFREKNPCFWTKSIN